MIALKNGDGIKWPYGKRIAVLLTFDFDAEYLRYSVTGQDTLGFSDISRGQYGPHEGLQRCLDMLQRQGIKTTFFVPGIVAEKYPQLICRSIACQFITWDIVAMFEFLIEDERIVKINERHYKIVDAAAISSEDLLSYRTHG